VYDTLYYRDCHAAQQRQKLLDRVRAQRLNPGTHMLHTHEHRDTGMFGSRRAGMHWVVDGVIDRIDPIVLQNLPMFPSHTGAGKMIYPKPGTEGRILPSVYTRLQNNWLRGDKTQISPVLMNEHHRKATAKLLKESHGNVTAKGTDLLGRLANHYSNQPDVVDALQKLCRRMQQVEVDEMYPVFLKIADPDETAVSHLAFDDLSMVDGL
jgi:hypothetical protein